MERPASVMRVDVDGEKSASSDAGFTWRSVTVEGVD